MDAIQGAGGMYSEMRPVSQAGRSVGETNRGLAQDLPKDTQGMGAVLSLSRDYVSAALQDSGFVDICGGSLAPIAQLATSGLSESRAGHPDLDPHTAGELAIQFGQQVTASSIEKILEIVLRPDPAYVVKLLR